MGLEFGPGEAIHLGAGGDDCLVGFDVVSPAFVGGGAKCDEGRGAACDAVMAEAAIGGDEEVEGFEDASHFGKFELGNEVNEGLFFEWTTVDFVTRTAEHGDFVALFDQVVDGFAEGFGGDEFLGPCSAGDDANGCALESFLSFGN